MQPKHAFRYNGLSRCVLSGFFSDSVRRKAHRVYSNALLAFVLHLPTTLLTRSDILLFLVTASLYFIKMIQLFYMKPIPLSRLFGGKYQIFCLNFLAGPSNSKHKKQSKSYFLIDKKQAVKSFRICVQECFLCITCYGEFPRKEVTTYGCYKFK